LVYLQAKHPELATDPKGSARINGQLAFAHAGQGERRRALRLIGRALRRNPLEKRALVALAVAAGAPAGPVAAMVRRSGRGI
jgi:hypothetical protein